MTGKELKEALGSLSDAELDKEVYFAYNYGDYWRTTVAGRIKEVELGWVKYSEYHSMMAVEEPDYDGSGNVEQENAIVLT